MSETAEPTTSRRDLLRRGAAGAAVAGAVWVTPSILTLDRAKACGSVPCIVTTEFVWMDEYGPDIGFEAGDPIPCAPTLAPSATVGGVTVTLSATQSTCPTRNQLNLTGGSWRTRTAGEAGWHLDLSQWLGGPVNTSSFFKARMGNGTATDADSSVDHQLVFSTPVRNLTFSILDIDAVFSGNTYRDIVWATGFNGGIPVAFTILFQLAPGAGGVILGSGTSGDPWYGTGLDSDPVPGNQGNVQICFGEPVDEVHVIHKRGRTNPPGMGGTALVSGQHIGISDMTWCA
jgi:hypothetical protein